MPPAHKLTPREIAVVLLITQGKTTHQIAVVLQAKPTTIRTYLQRVYRKTQTSTRPALVWWWAHHGQGQQPRRKNTH